MNSSITKLSDQVLAEKLAALSKKETEITAEILAHLAELDKRKLFRDAGYSSLYYYCVNGLGYSSPSAKRRITAARCISDYPEVYQLFLEKKVTLTTIAIFAPILTPENKISVLEQVAGRKSEEVEWVRGRYNPQRPSFGNISITLGSELTKTTSSLCL